MKVFGLIGYPLLHSRSPEYFNQLFRQRGLSDCTYRLFPISSLAGLPALIEQTPGLKGLNVTIPYKVSVIPYLDTLDTQAETVGAVNTIVISHRKGKNHLSGYNTDMDGFRNSADFSEYSHALILGTGGAARSVSLVLRQLGVDILLVSRNPTGSKMIHYKDLNSGLMQQYRLIINTTPLGMHPNENTCPPIPYEKLTGHHFLYDLVYHPQETLFLKQGARRGTKIQTGLRMLHRQADLSFTLFHPA